MSGQSGAKAGPAPDPTYLLDVSALLALLWTTHVHNARALAWQDKKKLAICPVSELGFVRISCQPTFGATVVDARKALSDWKAQRTPESVPCDYSILDTDAPSAGSQTTDFYLSSLADKHAMQLATFDQAIKHKAAFLIP